MDFTGLPQILDCHIHIPDGKNMEWAPATPDIPMMMHYLRRVHVGGGVMMSTRALLAESAQEMVEANHSLAQLISQNRGAWTGGLTIHPKWLDESVSLLRFWRDEGMAWVGECCGYISGYRYDEPNWITLLEEAHRLHMILHIHCDTAEMDTMAGRFPDMPFVLPHFPSRDQMPALLAMLQRRANVYFDICGSQYVRMGYLMSMVNAIGARRMLFGSDFTICDPSTVIARVAFESMKESQKRQIFSGTLMELLKRHGVELDVADGSSAA